MSVTLIHIWPYMDITAWIQIENVAKWLWINLQIIMATVYKYIYPTTELHEWMWLENSANDFELMYNIYMVTLYIYVSNHPLLYVKWCIN